MCELFTDVIQRVGAGLRGRIRDLPGSVHGDSWPIGMRETTSGYDKFMYWIFLKIIMVHTKTISSGDVMPSCKLHMGCNWLCLCRCWLNDYSCLKPERGIYSQACLHSFGSNLDFTWCYKLYDVRCWAYQILQWMFYDPISSVILLLVWGSSSNGHGD